MGTLAARDTEPLRSRALADEGGEAGFTLIEMMVVLLVMAILMAIAIPTFLGIRLGAEDRSAQSNITNATIAAKSLFATNGNFGPVQTQVSELQNEEPELTFTTNSATLTTGSLVSVYVSPDNNILFLADESADGRCWYIEVNEEQTPTADGVARATIQQGLSFGGTYASRSPITNCQANFIPGSSEFIGWGPSFPQ